MKITKLLVCIASGCALAQVPICAGPSQDEPTPPATAPANPTAPGGPNEDQDGNVIVHTQKSRAGKARNRNDLAAPDPFRPQAPATVALSAPGVGGFRFNSRRTREAGLNPLIVRTSNLDAKAQGNLEEDLAVMGHIFDKAIEELGDNAPRAARAMGIDVLFAPGGAPMRSLYLEGYGALFFVNVNFPLVAPASKQEEEKSSTTSSWEEAKEELYGQAGDDNLATGPNEEFSQEKVTQLRETLLDTLKQSSNIRALKPEDSVTVCVFGGGGSGLGNVTTVRRKALAGAGDMAMEPLLLERHSGQRGSTMTVRVKKADADALAQGKLTAEEFAKRATIATYASGLASGPGQRFGVGAIGGMGGGGIGGGNFMLQGR